MKVSRYKTVVASEEVQLDLAIKGLRDQLRNAQMQAAGSGQMEDKSTASEKLGERKSSHELLLL